MIGGVTVLFLKRDFRSKAAPLGVRLGLGGLSFILVLALLFYTKNHSTGVPNDSASLRQKMKLQSGREESISRRHMLWEDSSKEWEEQKESGRQLLAHENEHDDPEVEKLLVEALKKGQAKFREHLQSDAYKLGRKRRGQHARGRGIVISAGGSTNLANLYVTLYMLRIEHHCSLPVEIFYSGEDEFDMTSQRLFTDHFKRVRCIDTSRLNLPINERLPTETDAQAKQKNGFLLKSHMIFMTSFREVLVLDSDSIPLGNPAFLFDLPEYRETGSLFWPDFWVDEMFSPAPLYRILDLPNPWIKRPSLLTTESGQFLIDRKLHDDVLEWIIFLNLHSTIVYDFILGDKDTYRLAFALANKSEAFTQVNVHPAQAMGPIPPGFKDFVSNEAVVLLPAEEEANRKKLETDASKEAIKHAGMLQMAPDGRLIFLHRTGDSKLDPKVAYPSNFQPIHFITAPLSSRQAAVIHIKPRDGHLKMVTFDTETVTKKCRKIEEFNLLAAAEDCGIVDYDREEEEEERRQLEQEIDSDKTSDIDDDAELPEDEEELPPIPLYSIYEFPGLFEQMQKTILVFTRLQHAFWRREVPLGNMPIAKDLSDGAKAMMEALNVRG